MGSSVEREGEARCRRASARCTRSGPGWCSADWVDAVGGTTVEWNGFDVLQAPLIVSVPAEAPPNVMAAVAVVVLPVTTACPNELFS